MESYTEQVKRAGREFSSLHKASKQFLGLMQNALNKAADLSDTTMEFAKNSQPSIRDILLALGITLKTLAAEWSAAIGVLSFLPACFDIANDLSVIQGSIKAQHQAKAPFDIQANIELVQNAAVFERERIRNFRVAFENFGYGVMYMGAKAVEAGTNLQTLSRFLDPQMGVFGIATRFRSLELGPEIDIMQLLRISPEDLAKYAVSGKRLFYKSAGQRNEYPSDRRRRVRTSGRAVSSDIRSRNRTHGPSDMSLRSRTAQQSASSYKDITMEFSPLPTIPIAKPPEQPLLGKDEALSPVQFTLTPSIDEQQLGILQKNVKDLQEQMHRLMTKAPEPVSSVPLEAPAPAKSEKEEMVCQPPSVPSIVHAEALDLVRPPAIQIIASEPTLPPTLGESSEGHGAISQVVAEMVDTSHEETKPDSGLTMSSITGATPAPQEQPVVQSEIPKKRPFPLRDPGALPKSKSQAQPLAKVMTDPYDDLYDLDPAPTQPKKMKAPAFNLDTSTINEQGSPPDVRTNEKPDARLDDSEIDFF
ncbi:hypothetical protein GMRT_15795 [Giardia muris]|uniref:Uncharacterized protein n=1 Tax=Giardia muris TaxID=5742 RepID=A0A4Z1ST92_GIAMU|nr:hypothetical protein GMRT_15795 [Giardia muris]|eukprot:TNJ29152.1 hypothetical protein GMRT_15795 [Giardia muris]